MFWSLTDPDSKPSSVAKQTCHLGTSFLTLLCLGFLLCKTEVMMSASQAWEVLGSKQVPPISQVTLFPSLVGTIFLFSFMSHPLLISILSHSWAYLYIYRCSCICMDLCLYINTIEYWAQQWFFPPTLPLGISSKFLFIWFNIGALKFLRAIFISNWCNQLKEILLLFVCFVFLEILLLKMGFLTPT